MRSWFMKHIGPELPRVVLHIGTEKTGTTTIQRFLGRNRDCLKQIRLLHPLAPADRYHNHVGLAAYAAGDDRYDDLRRYYQVTDIQTLEQFRERLELHLADEITQERGRIDTVVLSNEHCHSRLINREDVERLATLLRPLSSEVSVIVYLRRQDRMAVSLYSTHVKSGGTDRDIFPTDTRLKNSAYYNFERLLDMWAEVFGDSAVTPRIYDRSSLKGGDIITDFMDVLGAKVPADFELPERLNESFLPHAQEFVRLLNERAASNECDLDAERLTSIVSYLASRYAGPGRRPSRETAMTFYEKFREANERLRKRWFPNRATLFDEDFSDYPQSDDVDELKFADAADLAVNVVQWCFKR